MVCEITDSIIGKLNQTKKQIVQQDRFLFRIVPRHFESQIHEQITHVLKGQLELTIDGIMNIFEEGKVAVIASNVKHSARALTDCKVMDVFSPAREDYKF